MTRPAPAPSLDTAEQLSGRAADAIADMHDDLRRRYSGLNSAEVQLAEALLAAHATTEASRQQLQEIQRQVIEAINNPVNALDTPAGERQFLIFLRSKVAEIQRIVDDGTLTAVDQAELTRALAGGYLGDDLPASPSPTSSEERAPTGPLSSGLAPNAPMSATPSAAMPQPAMGTPPPAGMPATPPALGGLPQAASPLGGLGSLLGSDDTATPEEQQGKISRGDADTDDDEDHDDAVDDDAPPTSDDAAPDDTGPAETRPAAG